MSYILNALRKSERERQAIQPDSVTSRIDVQPPAERHNLIKVVVALVLLNVAILAYFLGTSGRTTEKVVDTAALVETPPPTIAKARPLPLVEPAPQPASAALAAKIEQPRNQTPTIPLPGKAASENKPPLALPRQAVVAPQPALSATEANAEPVLDEPPAIEPEVPASVVPQTVAPPQKKPESVVAARPQNNLPGVDDLPADLRRTLPQLTINVFSYSPTPAERFVMIDMVKYVPGQTIKGELELQDIQEDGIVVRYESQVFKIKRQ